MANSEGIAGEVYIGKCEAMTKSQSSDALGYSYVGLMKYPALRDYWLNH